METPVSLQLLSQILVQVHWWSADDQCYLTLIGPITIIMVLHLLATVFLLGEVESGIVS